MHRSRLALHKQTLRHLSGPQLAHARGGLSDPGAPSGDPGEPSSAGGAPSHAPGPPSHGPNQPIGTTTHHTL